MTSSLKANKLRDKYYLNSQNKNKDTSFAFIFCKSGPKTKKKKNLNVTHQSNKREKLVTYPSFVPFPSLPSL